MKLLIDECLSEELTKLAQRRGHAEASHIAWIGKRGWKDWKLKSIILANDWTFVTKNSIDFRGLSDAPGSKGQYSDVTLHAGLICLNGPVGMDLDLQRELFATALDELDRDNDLVNQVLEITLTDLGEEIEVLRYKLPPK
jgi:predicted nuclease of predicted toxin-antitoxin system